MIRRSYILAAAVVFTLLPLNSLAADNEAPDAPLPPEGAAAKADAAAAQPATQRVPGQVADEEAWSSPAFADVVGRFGYWATDWHGSRTKIGEFQDLSSSPFWDVDGLWSSGERTIDFTATGTDAEGTQGRLYYFGPRLTVKADYERFLRRLDSRGLVVEDPHAAGSFIFENFDPHIPLVPPAPSAQQVLNSDVLNPGQDYAIRVQEFSARFHGPIGENLKWRVNVWGIDKQGVRQATRVAHCFNESTLTPGQPTGSRCHVLAQDQRIDWSTVEVEPVLEAKLGPLTAEYSRTMRSFDPNDQTVTRLYSQSGHDGWPIASTAAVQTPVPFDVQAENFTQIDRLKLSADLNDYNHLYGFLYVGNTENELRNTHRFFNGFDLRWTNDAIDGLKWTAYGKKAKEEGQLPTTFPEAPLITGGDSIDGYHHPLEYDRSSAGLKAQWRPYNSGWPAAEGLGFTGGYDYSLIARKFAEYEFHDPRWLTGPAPGTPDTFIFEQPDTKIHTFNVGALMRWSATLDSFLRYRYVSASNPIYGFRATNGDTNTNQPEQQDLIEIGGTWMPADNFLLSATFGIDVRSHDSQQDNLSHAFDVFHDNPRDVDFGEQSYPIVLSAWYAPTVKWSFTAGYASFSNFIDQLITLGDLYDDNLRNTGSSAAVNPTPPPDLIGARDYFEPDAFQSRWRYSGRAQVVNLGTAYAYSARLRLMGGYEYTWSRAVILAAPSPLTANDPSDTTPPPTVVVPDWTLLPSLSDVVVDTNRVTAGVDYLLRDWVTVFFRYSLFDYADLAGTGNSGTLHGFLGGVNAVF